MKLKIFISTCDKSQFILELFSSLWNKYVGLDCIVLGYNQNGLELPSNFKFVSINDSQDRIEDWAKHLRNYFLTIRDKHVMFMLDDYLPSDYWQAERFIKGYGAMKTDNKIARFELGKPSKFSIKRYEQPKGLRYFPSNANYRVSCQPSVWRRDWLCLALMGDYTPWLFEVKGTKARNNDGRDIIFMNPKVYSFGQQSCLSRQWEGKLNTSGTNPDDRPEIEEFARVHNLETFPK